MSKSIRYIVIGLAIPFVAAVAFILATTACFGFLTVLDTPPKVSEVTTPLEATVVQDVCQQLALSKSDPLCQAGATVYAPDFFPAIKAAFKPGVNTYDDVQKKLGKYQYYCEPPVAHREGDNFITIFVCHYDLNGDRVFPFAFSCTKDGIIDRIYASPRDRSG